MVAPLDINGVIAHQLVHDDMRPRTAVENIPHDVQVIYGQALDQLAERHNKLLRPADTDDGLHNRVIIRLLVRQIRLLGDELFHHVGKFRGKRLADLGARILARRAAADLDQPV